MHFIPLVNEIDQVITLTCRYCGVTTAPFAIIADEDGYVVPPWTVSHRPGCLLVLEILRH